MLQPYVGIRTAEHLGATGAPHETTQYGRDGSGTKVYRFNSLGYRGEEYDPDAKATIFVCGCSNTFGTGLGQEETWAHQFKLAYAARRGFAPSQVNLLNFAQGGASNDYIARALLTQCARVTPHLVLAQFTAMIRAEGFADGTPFSIGLGLWPGWSLWRRFLGVPWGEKRRVLARMRLAAGWSRYYAPEVGFVNALKNMLLVQQFCRVRGIPCAMSWLEHRRLSEPQFVENPVLAALVPLLDRDVLCDFGIRDADIRVDSAADNHPGPRSNAAFAARLFDFHERTVAGARP